VAGLVSGTPIIIALCLPIRGQRHKPGDDAGSLIRGNRKLALDDLVQRETIPLPLDAINVGQSDDNQPFLLLEVGIASLMFMVSPTCLEQIGQTMLTLSAKSSSVPS